MPFGLFKKKEGETTVELPTITVPTAGSLSIQEAQDLLRNIELAKVQELARRLGPIKESTTRSLDLINGLADEMDRQKIKLEGIEQRFRSVAENSRKTVVSSLRREASIELLLPQSTNDVKKFKERFETMMNRLSEVSSSHNRVITAFMKKHANKMNDEFDGLKKLFGETKTIVSDFEQERAPIVRCSGILNTASQKISSIKSAEVSMETMKQDIVRLENELNDLKDELSKLNSSQEFDQAIVVAQKASKAKKQEEQLHAQITDLFSHVSRAFTKYSYGLTKETAARLQMMSDAPWRILYESDISPYSLLLVGVHKSITTGTIQLKDSDKILNYVDQILRSLPEFQSSAQALKSEVDSLRQMDKGLVHTARELEKRIQQHEEELAKKRQNLEQQRRQVAEKNNEVDAQLKDASEVLVQLTGRKYLIQFQ